MRKWKNDLVPYMHASPQYGQAYSFATSAMLNSHNSFIRNNADGSATPLNFVKAQDSL